jgi:NADPH-dependent ferric siderophore reductase
VLVEVADAADERTFDSLSTVQVQWVRDRSHWLEALRELRLPDGEGFVWAAGEARTMATARDVLLKDKQHPLETMRVSAYWKEGHTAFHEAL